MDDRKKLYEQVVVYFGNQDLTATALNVKQPTVSAWISGKCGMSPETAMRCQIITRGRFRADLLCPRLIGLVELPA